MTPKQIKRRADTIKSNIEKWNNALEELQDSCKHENASHIDKADTGNWCTSDDSYWTVHHCTDCGKHWTTDQDWDIR